MFDSLGRQTLRDSFRIARRKGLVINYGNITGSVKDLDPIELGEAGSVMLTRPRLADHIEVAEIVRYRAVAVFREIALGSPTIDVSGHYGLRDIPELHAMLEGRKQIGKAVIAPG